MVSTLEIICKVKPSRALRALKKEGKLTTTKLSKAIGHKTTASVLLDQLLKKKHVRRTVLQDKRRRVIWELTPKGKKLCKILDQIDQLDKQTEIRDINS